MQSLIQLLLKGKESETLPCSVLPSKPQCLSNGSVRVEEVVEEDNKTEQSTPVTQGREGPLLDGTVFREHSIDLYMYIYIYNLYIYII